MTMKFFVLLILMVFASEKKTNAENSPKNEERYDEEKLIFVKIEEDNYAKVSKTSKFIGVSYHRNKAKWQVQRWSKTENKIVSNGHYDDEETAAHASDTLARQLIKNGEQNRKLNFPDDHIEVYAAKTSKFIGVSYNKKSSKWSVKRWSKAGSKSFTNGSYKCEETAAHASDTLARKLMTDEEKDHKLNFPDEYIEVYRGEKSSKFIGVTYNKNESRWQVQRWSKNENKKFFNGYYDDEETAAHASDTLARKLMENEKQNHKLNFPDDHTEVYPEEKTSKFFGVSYSKNSSKWIVQRWSKNESKTVFNGYYDDEETAAHASDTLARKLMKNGEQNHKLNFPDDHTGVYPENQKNKRKRPKKFGLEHPQNN